MPSDKECHDCCPKEWRQTPILTGSYELDAGIARNANKDLQARLRFYASRERTGYGPRTAYNGYSGLAGDE